MNTPFSVTLSRVRTLSSTTRDFRFVRDDGEPMVYEPGQFCKFRFTDSQGSFERSYSLCNFTDGAECELDLLVSVVDGGRASQLLFDCEPGIEAQVTGPYGRLVLPDPLPERLFLVATSVGLAPFLPMLSRLVEPMTEGLRVVLLFGIRNSEEFIYRETLLGFEAGHPNFQLITCVSRDEHLTEGHRAGYVTDALTESVIDPSTDHFLLCGNPGMIDDCYDLLKKRGCRARQVVREKYVFARQEKTGDEGGKKALTETQKRLIEEKVRRYRKD